MTVTTQKRHSRSYQSRKFVKIRQSSYASSDCKNPLHVLITSSRTQHRRTGCKSGRASNHKKCRSAWTWKRMLSFGKERGRIADRFDCRGHDCVFNKTVMRVDVTCQTFASMEIGSRIFKRDRRRCTVGFSAASAWRKVYNKKDFC